jgi:hypothetical protein
LSGHHRFSFKLETMKTPKVEPAIFPDDAELATLRAWFERPRRDVQLDANARRRHGFTPSGPLFDAAARKNLS